MVCGDTVVEAIAQDTDVRVAVQKTCDRVLNVRLTGVRKS
jgi:hypothetical protein